MGDVTVEDTIVTEPTEIPGEAAEVSDDQLDHDDPATHKPQTRQCAQRNSHIGQQSSLRRKRHVPRQLVELPFASFDTCRKTCYLLVRAFDFGTDSLDLFLLVRKFERALILERQREGITAAKARCGDTGRRVRVDVHVGVLTCMGTGHHLLAPLLVIGVLVAIFLLAGVSRKSNRRHRSGPWGTGGDGRSGGHHGGGHHGGGGGHGG